MTTYEWNTMNDIAHLLLIPVYYLLQFASSNNCITQITGVYIVDPMITISARYNLRGNNWAIIAATQTADNMYHLIAPSIVLTRSLKCRILSKWLNYNLFTCIILTVLLFIYILVQVGCYELINSTEWFY